jgi:hypothetical protein
MSSPEISRSPEVASERSLESLDMTHEMEYVLSIIIESGPELDPDYLAALYDYLDHLIRLLDIPSDDPFQYVQDLKDKLGIQDDKVTNILTEYGLPNILREVIEKILAGRHEGLSDKTIYHRLARIYHPDQTQLDPERAEEIFKLIGQRLYDEDGGFSLIF